MNKLLLNPEIEIRENGFYLVRLSSFVHSKVTVFPHVHATLLFLGEDVSSKIEIVLLEGANLVFQTFGVDLALSFSITLKEYGASLKFIYSAICRNYQNLQIDVFHLGINTTSNFYNHVVSFGKNKSLIEVNASVPKGKKGCVLRQDNRIVPMDDGDSTILPNLLIDEFDCFAEHSAYIAKFSAEKLFYLQMRGISEKDAQFLLMKSFLLGNMELEEDIEQEMIEAIQKNRGGMKR